MRRVKGYKYYLIGADGRVYNTKRKKFLKPVLRRYKQVSLYKDGVKKSFHVHRLVAMCWLGDCDGFVVSHKNHNTYDNRVSNLEAVSQKENIGRSVSDKRNAFGEKQHLSKLTSEDVLFIRQSGKSNLMLAKQFGISPTTVRDVRNRKTWKHI